MIGSLCFLLFITCAIAFVGYRIVLYCIRLIEGEVSLTVGGVILALIYFGGCVLGSVVCVHFAKAWWTEFRNK